MKFSTKIVLAAAVAAFAGCQYTRPLESAALKAAEIACIFAPPIDGAASEDARLVALACKIDKDVIPVVLPVIERMIAERKAAARAGFRWQDPLDGGGSEAGR